MAEEIRGDAIANNSEQRTEEQNPLGNNRFVQAASGEETLNAFDQNRMLLSIMRDEFPDDFLYRQNQLTPNQPGTTRTSAETEPEIGTISSREKFDSAVRNEKGVLRVSTEKDRFAPYQMTKLYPTVDEDELDELIDEEWEFFEDAEEDDTIVTIEEPAPSGLFLVNSETDLGDFHDLYISGGPQTIDPDAEDITNRVFCVFFIINGKAYAIPTYKTLEVMLVERGLTYDDITEATSDEVKDFDLLLDGQTEELDDIDFQEFDEDEDGEITAYEEFIQRSLPTRDSDWNISIRFRSGYLPKTPFLRDPGDYIKPESMRATEGRTPTDEDGNELPPDRFVKEDPADRYFDRVFQKQTYKEKLREKYEGKMIVGDWPVPYDQGDVTQDTDIASDDAVLNIRMMMQGHWKFVRGSRTMQAYAYVNDIDISEYSPSNAGRYGEKGMVQLLIDNGGCTVVPTVGDAANEEREVTDAGGAVSDTRGVNSVLEGDNSFQNDSHPLWSAFPHIVDVDEDQIKGIDTAEYQEYIDNYNNGGNPFDITELKDFEPPGSLAYYNKTAYMEMVEAAIAQEQIDAIKDQIYEIWPSIAAKVEQTKIQIDALPTDLTKYYERKLGPKGPLYKLFISRKGKWKYVKKKRKKLKTKKSKSNLFKVCSKTLRIKWAFNEKQEEKIVSKYKWMKTVQRDKFAAWMSGGVKKSFAYNAVGTTSVAYTVGASIPIGVALATGISAAVGAAAANAAALAAGTTTITFIGAGGATVTATCLPTVTVVPSIGQYVVGAITNPITLGVAAVVGAFFLVDKLAGEVPADEYDLPPWRFMDDNWYLKACIYNEVDDEVDGFNQAAQAADENMPWVKDTIDTAYQNMGLIDEAILQSMEVSQFEAILANLTGLENLLDQLNEGDGVFSQVTQVVVEIDNFLANELKKQYRAIQFMRKKVHNKIGRKKKFGIAWPKGPQKILNEYVPGLTFDNYLPGQ